MFDVLDKFTNWPGDGSKSNYEPNVWLYWDQLRHDETFAQLCLKNSKQLPSADQISKKFANILSDGKVCRVMSIILYLSNIASDVDFR